MSLLFSADSCAPAAFRRVLAVSLAVMLAATSHAQQSVKRVIDEQGTFDTGSQASQKRVTRYAQQTSELLGEYRITLQQLDRVRVYNANLAAIVSDQQQEIDNINQQLLDFESTEQGIVPLMLDMITDLRAFIEADMPFNREERIDRVERLEANMTNSDITVSERYRQIMDAYKKEAAFGRNIEAYEGTLPVEGVDTQVNILRVGRIVLAFQTKDEATTGIYNKSSGQWETVGSEYRRAVSDGIAQARKEAPPNLMVLPVPTAEAAR
ncbi:MAG: DUF3450 domain-containing protein [Pseudomonadota bacterium]